MRKYDRNLNAEWHVSSDGQPRKHGGGIGMTTTAIVKFDGGARPNPGQGAIGYIVETDDWIEEESESLDGGETTNIRAEYHALIRGLEVAREKGCTAVEAKGDLELVVKQVRGEWSVNEPSLYPLYHRAQELADGFENFEICHVPRKKNWEADQLVKKGFSD